MKNIWKKKIYTLLLCLALSLQVGSIKPFFGLGRRLNNVYERVSRSSQLYFGAVLGGALVAYCMFKCLQYFRTPARPVNPVNPDGTREDNNGDNQQEVQVGPQETKVKPKKPRVDQDPKDGKKKKVTIINLPTGKQSRSSGKLKVIQVRPKTHACTSCNTDNKMVSDCTRLSCGHMYCNECLERIIDEAIDRQSSANLRCPRCAKEIENCDVRAITQNNDQKEKLIGDILTKEWLEKAPNTRHCPTSGCGYVFISEDPQPFTCPNCKSNYCSDCLFPHREGISCDLAALARQKSKDAEKKSDEIKVQNEVKAQVDKKEVPKIKKPKYCPLCFEDKLDHYQLPCCKHSSCNECLETFIDIAIKDKNTSRLKCPACSVPIKHNQIREITNCNGDKMDALSDIMTKEYLDTLPDARSCPTPNCPYIAWSDEKDEGSVNCPHCQRDYCWSCRTAHSRGVSCREAKEFRDRCKDKSKLDLEKANEKWIKERTKPCPRCKAPVEKNEGCNHMTCKCGHHFCWQCLVRFRGGNDHPNNGCPVKHDLFAPVPTNLRLKRK